MTVEQAEDMQRRLGNWGTGEAPSLQPAEALPFMRQYGIHVYPVRRNRTLSLGHALYPDTTFDRDNLWEFLHFAEATGGLAFNHETLTPELVRQIFSQLADHFLTEFVVAFRAPANKQPRLHHLEVRLRPGMPGVVTGGAREAVY